MEGERAPDNARTVTRYTFVPIGLVALAVGLTASGMWWYFQGQLDKEGRVSKIEARLNSTRDTQESIRDMLGKLELDMSSQQETLNEISKQLRLMNYRLNQSGNTPPPSSEHDLDVDPSALHWEPALEPPVGG